ncbi:hypothetical protein BJF78_00775 [Pseudonocardia sp. CNS-139]|nr:hypothetical protein BJF78_00775 [Pseudonocardia sp. CNS-139]
MLAAPLAELLGRSLADGGAALRTALGSAVFLDAVWRTLWLALVATLVTVGLGTVYALAVAVGPAWVRAFLVAGLLVSLWTSVMVRTFGWMLLELPTGALYWLLHNLGLADAPLQVFQTTAAMYPAMVAVMLPFAVLAVLGPVTAIDRDLLAAAAVSGAGPLLTFRTVVLPSLRGAMISGGVLVFVMSLGFYVTPLLLGGPSNLTVSGLINAQLRTANRIDVGAAMSVLLIAGTVGAYLIADRLFRVSERWGGR